jgi:hypothetical protein
MMTRGAGILACLALLAGCNAFTDSQPAAFAEPPASTYTAATFEVGIDTATEQVTGASVSPEFFREAKVTPMLGRAFAVADAVTGQRVAVIGQDLWVRRLGSDPSIIGRPIRLDGRPAIVVGVMPKGFSVPKGASVWVPR